MAILARKKWLLSVGMCWTPTSHTGVKTCASSSFIQFLTSSKGKWRNTGEKKEEKKQDPSLALIHCTLLLRKADSVKSPKLSLYAAQSVKSEYLPAGGHQGEVLLYQQQQATVVRAPWAAGAQGIKILSEILTTRGNTALPLSSCR